MYPLNFSRSIDSPRIKDSSKSLGILIKKHYGGGGGERADKYKNFRGKCHILLAEKRAWTKLGQGHTASVLMGHHSGL